MPSHLQSPFCHVKPHPQVLGCIGRGHLWGALFCQPHLVRHLWYCATYLSRFSVGLPPLEGNLVPSLRAWGLHAFPSPLVLLCPPCGPRDSPRGSLPLPRLYEPPGQIDSPLASHLMFRTACLLRSLVEPPKGRGSDSFLLLCPHTWHSMWHVATPGKPVILS